MDQTLLLLTIVAHFTNLAYVLLIYLFAYGSSCIATVISIQLICRHLIYYHSMRYLFQLSVALLFTIEPYIPITFMALISFKSL
jgi:hypothetical protein